MRTIRTQEAIMSAMLTVLEKVPFRNMTINDICAEAGVSRTTFYLHFEDKYHLIISYIASHFQTALDDFDGTNVEDFYTTILGLMHTHRIALIRLVEYDQSKELKKKMDTVLTNVMAEFYRRRHYEKNIKLEMPFDIVINFVSHGISGILIAWIEDDLRMPIEELACYLARIHMYDFYSLSPDYVPYKTVANFNNDL